MEDYDAIVVGAGPAGSASAALLARQGFSVLLLDRAAFPRDKACGEYTSPQTEKVLQRLGALDAVMSAGARRLPQMRVISPHGRSVSLNYSQGDPFGPHVLATPRRILDATLVEHARRSGAEVRERTKVEAVTMRDGKASGILIRKKDGTTHEERARLIVGADGIHSVVVRSLGLQAPLKWPRNLGMIAHYTGYNGLDSWGEMHVSHRGYAGLAPQSDGLLNVGLVMPEHKITQMPQKGAVARFEAFANSFPGVKNCLQGAQRTDSIRGVGPIGARVKRTSGPGYLLVGDAAGFFDPFTGEGVHKALRGAELAAHIATHALTTDNLSARSLARYSRLRRKEFAAKEWVCRMLQLFVVFSPGMDYVVPRLAQRPSVTAVMSGVLGDYTNPRAALSPFYLWSLLRP